MRFDSSVTSCGRMAAFAAGMLLATIVGAAPAAAFDVKAAEKSTVRIYITLTKDGKQLGGAAGSGFVIDDEYVATNEHVAKHSQVVAMNVPYKLHVLNPYTRQMLTADIVWVSKELDLAVLRVKGLTLPPAELTGREPLHYPAKGQAVIVLGYPGISDTMFKDDKQQNVEEMLRQATVTRGVVGRTLQGTFKGKLRPVIQHDAAISGGNSGGPLFDACNRIVGVNTFGVNHALKVVKDEKGNQYAVGSVPPGQSFAPHISNLIDAVRTVTELKDVSVRISSEECTEEAGGMSPVMIAVSGAALLVALSAVALVMFRRREVVRVVESYSAWINRKGLQPGAQRVDSAVIARSRASRATPPPREATAPPAAAGDWTLTGTDAKQNPVALSFSNDELDKAAGKQEKGLVVGRSSTLADKIIDDTSVSRRHAKFTPTDAGLAVEDLKSAYGTTVNGHKLEPFQPVLVEPGDQIVLGAVTLQLGRG